MHDQEFGRANKNVGRVASYVVQRGLLHYLVLEW